MRPWLLRSLAIALGLCALASEAYPCEIQIGGSTIATAPAVGGNVKVRVPMRGDCATFTPEAGATRLSTQPFGIIPPDWATFNINAYTREKTPFGDAAFEWTVAVTRNTTGAARTFYINVRFISSSPPGQTSGTWHSIVQPPEVTDLSVSTLTTTTAKASPGGKIEITDTVRNTGTGGAGASTTRYYLRTGPSMVPLTGTRAVPSIDPGKTNTDSADVVVPWTIPPGDYTVSACANEPRVLTETNYSDNCFHSAARVRIVGLMAAISLDKQPQLFRSFLERDNHKLLVRLALGASFTLQIFEVATPVVGPPSTTLLESEFVLGSSLFSASSDISPLSAFRSYVVLPIQDTPQATSWTGIATHRGEVELTITPTSPSFPVVRVKFEVLTPDRLGLALPGNNPGGTNNATRVTRSPNSSKDDILDPKIIDRADRWGIPPHVIKGLIQHETANSFRQYTYRYEPKFQRDHFEGPPKKTTTPSGAARVEYPQCKVGEVAVPCRVPDPEFFAYAMEIGRNDVGPLGPRLNAADVKPREFFFIDGRQISAADTDITAAQIVAANNSRINWWKDPKELKENLELLPFVAQTTISASYGLMQIMFPTAVMVLQRVVRPSELFDVDLNLDIGVRHLRDKLSKRVFDDPESFSEIGEWYREMEYALIKYNANRIIPGDCHAEEYFDAEDIELLRKLGVKPGVHCYGSQVLESATRYLPSLPIAVTTFQY